MVAGNIDMAYTEHDVEFPSVTFHDFFSKISLVQHHKLYINMQLLVLEH